MAERSKAVDCKSTGFPITGSNPVERSKYSFHSGSIAQLVEQETENFRVTGSIPVVSTILILFHTLCVWQSGRMRRSGPT